MPTIQPGGKVLVTGANGFIGIWVARTLLEKGYAVRAVVRSETKGAHLKKLFNEKYGDKFEIVVIEDITRDGAFDEAVKGVDAIEHVASPFHMKAVDPEEIIGPALKGTTSILQSALAYGTSLKRIVITSSCVAVFQVSPEPHTYSETDWNEDSILKIKELGKEALPIHKYSASKTLAEKAAWDFWNKNKDSVSWDLTVLNPPYVFGPFIHEASSVSALNTSSFDWYNTVIGGSKSDEVLATQGSSWVDVRDLALAHSLALEKEEAGGERIIISKDPFIWQEWVNTANSLSPTPIPSKTLPRGNPDGAKNPRYPLQYVTAKEAKIFGIQFRSKEESARDILADFEARKW